MKPVVNLYKLGRLSYVKALNIQQALFDKLKTNLARNSLILVEHEPVYTIGIRSNQYNDDYVSRLKRKLDEHKLKADFVKTNRGGLITFHGPGQFVAYPIIRLGDFREPIQNRSVKAYVSLLETTIIDTLARVGIEGAHTVREYPGVWLDGGERKIAFIGIACKCFTSMHGISINCDCDLSWFDHIVSCGIEGKAITSVRQELVAKERGHRDSHQDSPTTTAFIHGRHQLVSVGGGSSSDLTLPVSSPASKESKSSDLLYSSSASKCPESSIERISEAFCVSFSRYFDCNLIDNSDSQFISGIRVQQ